MATATLTGSQTATTRSVPRGAGDDSAARLARALGYDLLPWQEEILTLSAITVGGRWKAFENVVIAPRQQGKSFVVIPRALAGVLLYGERLVLYSAHEARTATETWLMMREACTSEAVEPYVRNIIRAPGREYVEFINGSRFMMISRTKLSGRGMSPDCVLLDEAFSLTGEVSAALLPSMSARPNPQVYYLSSAGTWQSEVLLGLRRRGHAKASNRFAYWEWHAHADDDHRDERVWAKCNPSYGSKLQSRDSVSRELESMSERAFRRERLGIWTESFAETVLGEDDVHSITVDAPPAPRDGRPIAWGVSVAHDRTLAAIVATFTSDEGVPVCVLVEARPGAGWLPERLGQLQDIYEGDGFAFDAKGGIVDLMERAARDYEVPIIPLKYNDYPAACAGFSQAVADKRVRIGRSPALVTDAVHATARMLSNGWVWDLRVTTPPLHLVAATCSYWALEHGTGASGVAVY